MEVIVDYGGLVEDLFLRSQITGESRRVLLTHNNQASAVEENTWWQGMLLIPWANRIAYVSIKLYVLFTIHHKHLLLLAFFFT